MARKIDQDLQAIREAVYGEQVRGAIIDGIEQAYLDANDVVKVSETQPTAENVKLWVKPESDEYKVPTWEEHMALEDEVADLKSAFDAQRQKYNLIPNEYQSIAQRGNPCIINNIKYTANTLGEVTVEAVSESHLNSTYYIARESETAELNMPFSLPLGEYICYLANTIPTNTRVSITTLSGTRLLDFTTEARSFTVSDATEQYRLLIYVSSSANVNSPFVVKPMICKSGDNYAYIAPWDTYAGFVPAIISNIQTIEDDISAVKANVSKNKNSILQKINVLPSEYYSSIERGNPCTINGITYNVHENGEVEVSGTATLNSSFYISGPTVSVADPYTITPGTYLLYTDIYVSGLITSLRNADNTQISVFGFGAGDEREVSLTEANKQYIVRLTVNQGTTIPSGTILKPMIVKKSDFIGYVAPWATDSEYSGVISQNINIIKNTGDDAINRQFIINNPSSAIISVAHRGCGKNSYAPENTIPGFIYGRKMGYTHMEIDVRYTADNPPIPVLCHDETINRTARMMNGDAITGDVTIANSTLAQLRQYDYGIAYGSQYAGTPIPTLAEAMTWFRAAGVTVYIDLKGTQTDEIDEILTSTVQNAGMMSKTYWVTATRARLVRIARTISNANLVVNGINSSESVQNLIDTINTIKAIASYHGKIIIGIITHDNPAVNGYLEYAKENGYEVLTGPYDSETAMIDANEYATYMISNYELPSVVLYNHMMA